MHSGHPFYCGTPPVVVQQELQAVGCGKTVCFVINAGEFFGAFQCAVAFVFRPAMPDHIGAVKGFGGFQEFGFVVPNGQLHMAGTYAEARSSNVLGSLLQANAFRPESGFHMINTYRLDALQGAGDISF